MLTKSPKIGRKAVLEGSATVLRSAYPAEHMLVAAGEDGTIMTWDAATMRCSKWISRPSDDSATVQSIFVNHRFIFAGQQDGAVKVLSKTSASVKYVLEGLAGPVVAVAAVGGNTDDDPVFVHAVDLAETTIVWELKSKGASVVVSKTKAAWTDVMALRSRALDPSPFRLVKTSLRNRRVSSNAAAALAAAKEREGEEGDNADGVPAEPVWWLALGQTGIICFPYSEARLRSVDNRSLLLTKGVLLRRKAHNSLCVVRATTLLRKGEEFPFSESVRARAEKVREVLLSGVEEA